jgi:hypothetical protein
VAVQTYLLPYEPVCCQWVRCTFACAPDPENCAPGPETASLEKGVAYFQADSGRGCPKGGMQAADAASARRGLPRMNPRRSCCVELHLVEHCSGERTLSYPDTPHLGVRPTVYLLC